MKSTYLTKLTKTVLMITMGMLLSVNAWAQDTKSLSGLEEEVKKALQMFDAYDILTPYGFVVAQHFKKDKLPNQSQKLKLIKESSYGDAVLSFYRKVA